MRSVARNTRFLSSHNFGECIPVPITCVPTSPHCKRFRPMSSESKVLSRIVSPWKLRQMEVHDQIPTFCGLIRFFPEKLGLCCARRQSALLPLPTSMVTSFPPAPDLLCIVFFLLGVQEGVENDTSFHMPEEDKGPRDRNSHLSWVPGKHGMSGCGMFFVFRGMCAQAPPPPRLMHTKNVLPVDHGVCHIRFRNMEKNLEAVHQPKPFGVGHQVGS